MGGKTVAKLDCSRISRLFPFLASYAEAKIQELAERKMRSDKPELCAGNGDCS
jgi:hypothetical protein